MNAIKDSIKSGRTVVGTAGAPNVDVSILADAGYDFLLFDTQHSPWEIKQLQPSIQAMRGKQAAPLVRVAAVSELGDLLQVMRKLLVLGRVVVFRDYTAGFPAAIISLKLNADGLIVDADDKIFERRLSFEDDFAVGNAAGDDGEAARFHNEALMNEFKATRALESDDQVRVEMEMEAGMFHHMVSQLWHVQMGAHLLGLTEMVAQNVLAQPPNIALKRMAYDVVWHSKFFIKNQSIFASSLVA